jgi:hypothetical protein
MVLLLLIRYVLPAAKRRWNIDVSLSALLAVVVLALSLLVIKTAGDLVPREEIQVALLR